jgi:predicted  nucleic acid-binding Zn-ribbon protein
LHFTEALELMIELQKMDSGLDDLEKIQRVARQEIAALEGGLSGAKAKLQEDKKAQEELAKERKTIEIEAGSLDTKIKKYQSQEAEVKSNEQFLALKHETEKAKEDKGKSEEKILELMFREDEQKKKVQGSALELDQAEKKLAADRKALETKITDCDKAAADKRIERKAKLAQVPEDLATGYESLRNHGKKIAVAQVMEDQTCSGCKMKVPPQVLNEIKKGMAIQRCDCSRFLYVKG